jgi:long-chain fatty acid transport protein
MKLHTTLTTFILVFLLAGSLFASGVAITGIGARATAMCGAYRGVANDWSAMFWNPAGITQIKGFQFGTSFEIIMPNASYNPAKWSYIAPPMFVGNPDTVETNFTNMRAGKTENEPKTFFIPALGFTYEMSDKLTVGFAVYAPFGLGAEWDLLDTGKYNSKYPKIDYEDDLKILDFHPTIAYKVSDNLSVGVGLSIIYADIIIRTPKYIPNPYLTNTTLAGFRTTLSFMGATDPEYNHLLIDSELAGTGMGFGGNIGLLLNVTDNLKLGLTARYYNDVSIDGIINATAYFADHAEANAAVNAGLKPVLDGKLASGEITEQEYGALINYYSGGTSAVYDDVSGDTKLPLPMEFGVGLSYTGINNLLIAADFAMVKWSAWDEILIELETGEESNLIEHWDDGFRASLGLEYSLGLLKLRGGYYYESSVVPDETLSPTIPDINTRGAFSLGFQYGFGPLVFHMNYEKILIGDKTVKDYVFNASENSYDNLAGVYSADVNNIMLGLGYAF